jgi:stress response protein YsnF
MQPLDPHQSRSANSPNAADANANSSFSDSTPASSTNHGTERNRTEVNRTEVNRTEVNRTDSSRLNSHETLDSRDSSLNSTANPANPLRAKSIELLEEKLVVNRRRRKIGEVVVRKKIETDIVEVPIQREVLVVEQVGSDAQANGHQTIAEVDLNQVAVLRPDDPVLSQLSDAVTATETAANVTVQGEFLTPQDASLPLGAIADVPHHGCEQVQITCILQKGTHTEETYHQFATPQTAEEFLNAIATALMEQCRRVQIKILLNDAKLTSMYQNWLDRPASIPPRSR